MFALFFHPLCPALPITPPLWIHLPFLKQTFIFSSEKTWFIHVFSGLYITNPFYCIAIWLSLPRLYHFYATFLLPCIYIECCSRSCLSDCYIHRINDNSGCFSDSKLIWDQILKDSLLSLYRNGVWVDYNLLSFLKDKTDQKESASICIISNNV